jgi:hypothetical protein
MESDKVFNECLKNIANIIGSFGATPKEAIKASRVMQSSKKTNKTKRKKK